MNGGVGMIQKLMNKKNKKGFTLIELIVVIAIIAILAAILIPRMTGFTDKAKATQAIVNAKQVATAIDSFIAEGTAPASLNKTAVASMAGIDVALITFAATPDGGFTVLSKTGETFTAGRADPNDPVGLNKGP